MISSGYIYTDDGLAPGTERYYRVRAVNGATPGEGSWSAVRSATTEAVPPGSPLDLRARANGGNAISLTWTEPEYDGGADITTYEIQKATFVNPDGGNNFSWLTTRNASAGLTYDHTGLEQGDTLHYRVRACNKQSCDARRPEDWGDWSNTSKATTETGAPAAPRITEIRASGSTEITLAWTEPDDQGEPVQFYEVERAESDNGPWMLLTVMPGDTREYIDTRLTPGTTRYYRVAARNFNGLGEWSPARSATTGGGDGEPVPSAPTGLTTVAGDEDGGDREEAITLSWANPGGSGEGINRYRVERSRSADGPWELLTSGVSGSTFAYTDTRDLYRGMTRYYRVAARNSNGWGEWSLGPV